MCVWRDLCWCKMYESGCPGMVVAIAVDGKVRRIMNLAVVSAYAATLSVPELEPH